MIELFLGDCLEIMRNIDDNSIDMILCDLPYGTTRCKWDIPIPFKFLWKEYERITKETANIILTSAQPFTSKLILSNLNLFKYELIWNKRKVTGFLNAKKRPLVQHENILVFYKKFGTYNPIMHDNKLKREFKEVKKIDKTKVYGKQKSHIKNIEDNISYPRSIIEKVGVLGNSDEKVNHPTQKPIGLFEYLIKTYSNPNDLVLDNCMGSGTTGVACKRNNRNFIGIELDKGYFDIAKDRIDGENNLLEFL